MSNPKKNYTYIGTSTNQADKVFDRVKYDQMIADKHIGQGSHEVYKT